MPQTGFSSNPPPMSLHLCMNEVDQKLKLWVTGDKENIKYEHLEMAQFLTPANRDFLIAGRSFLATFVQAFGCLGCCNTR